MLILHDINILYINILLMYINIYQYNNIIYQYIITYINIIN